MDRPAHPELRHHAWTDAANLVSSNRVSGGATQPCDFHLDLIGFIERERYLGVGEGSSWRTPLIVAPLPQSQCLQHCTRLRHRLGEAVSCDGFFIPSEPVTRTSRNDGHAVPDLKQLLEHGKVRRACFNPR